jgi:hypothetical protein
VTRDDGMSINVRLSFAQLASLDFWMDGLSRAKLSRAEAIRRLIDLGLSHASANGRLSPEARAKASAMAAPRRGSIQIKRFHTSEDALAFLKRCDAAGRIIH